MDTVRAGTIVHVASDAEERDGRCRPALVLAPGVRLTAVRIFGRSQWEDDEWGDVRRSGDPIRVPNPDGTWRTLDTWHPISECEGQE